MECREANRFIPAYVDGEFAGEDRTEFESHIAGCEGCRSQARRAEQWKAAVRTHLEPAAVPREFEQRVIRALDDETAAHSGWRWFGWRIGPGLMAAAALGMLVLRVRVVSSPVLEASILDHLRDWPVEVVGPDPEGVSSWFRGKLDFPVRPLRLGKGTHLLGGRIGHLEKQHAAQLVYVVSGGHKVTVFIFDPGELTLDAPRRVVVQDHPIYVGTNRGYHVAMFEDQGIGYALASDLDERDMIGLVGTSLRGRP